MTDNEDDQSKKLRLPETALEALPRIDDTISSVGATDIAAKLTSTDDMLAKLASANDVAAKLTSRDDAFAKLTSVSDLALNLTRAEDPISKFMGANDAAANLTKNIPSLTISDSLRKATEALTFPAHDASVFSALDLARRHDEALGSLTISDSVRKATEALTLPSHVSASVFSALDLATRHDETLRLAHGAISDIERLGVFDALPRWSALSVAELIAQAQSNFRLPEIAEANRLAQSVIDAGTISLGHSSAVQAAMEAMRSPWLSVENELASAKSFAALQDIGRTLDTMNAFEDATASLVRNSLGDWREEIAWPKAIFEDISARGRFYEELGFDPSLTDRPAPAFEESVEAAGLLAPAPRTIEVLDYEIPAGDEVQESALARTIAAQERLLRFEWNLRRFIEAQMTAAYGKDWIDRQVDPETVRQWREKKEKAESNGDHQHALIDYADFTDYERVIVKRDNWRTVFQPIFKKRESVLESLQRLYPVRICSFHARLLTQDDELLLYVEVKRILVAIGVLKRR